MGYASQPNPAFGYYRGVGSEGPLAGGQGSMAGPKLQGLGIFSQGQGPPGATGWDPSIVPVPAGDRGDVRVRVDQPGAAVTLKEILRELAGRVNALHLHEAIDALPDETPAKSTAKAKGDA